MPLIKWINERDNLIELIDRNVSYEEIGRIYEVSGSRIRNVLDRLDIPVNPRRAINPSESANRRQAKYGICKNCNKSFKLYASTTGVFCSGKCFFDKKRSEAIERWKSGEDSGTVNYSCSGPVRRYMLDKYQNKCQECGWGTVNEFTGKVPLHIHHIDGDSTNNIENNLMVLCPNCHALTENFGSRNKNAPRGKSLYYGKAKK